MILVALIIMGLTAWYGYELYLIDKTHKERVKLIDAIYQLPLDRIEENLYQYSIVEFRDHKRQSRWLCNPLVLYPKEVREIYEQINKKERS